MKVAVRCDICKTVIDAKDAETDYELDYCHWCFRVMKKQELNSELAGIRQRIDELTAKADSLMKRIGELEGEAS